MEVLASQYLSLVIPTTTSLIPTQPRVLSQIFAPRQKPTSVLEDIHMRSALLLSLPRVFEIQTGGVYRIFPVNG